jgi:chromosome segregation ATPase
MKSLRGKGGIDLIFKGSKAMPSANHAKVTITFDNSKKIFSFSNSGLGVSLDYDEVSISREVGKQRTHHRRKNGRTEGGERQEVVSQGSVARQFLSASHIAAGHR